MQNRNLSKPIITNKKAQIRNQTLFQYDASSHKKLEGSPEIGTVFLSRGLGVYGRVYFVWFAETAHKAHHGTFSWPWAMAHGPWAMAHGPWPRALGLALIHI